MAAAVASHITQTKPIQASSNQTREVIYDGAGKGVSVKRFGRCGLARTAPRLNFSMMTAATTIPKHITDTAIPSANEW